MRWTQEAIQLNGMFWRLYGTDRSESERSAECVLKITIVIVYVSGRSRSDFWSKLIRRITLTNCQEMYD